MHIKYESVQVVLEVIILILCNDAIIITEIKRIFHCLNRKHSDICVSKKNSGFFTPKYKIAHRSFSVTNERITKPKYLLSQSMLKYI